MTEYQIKLGILKFVYKEKNSVLSSYFNNYFVRNGDIFSYSTRNSNKFNIDMVWKARTAGGVLRRGL